MSRAFPLPPLLALEAAVLNAIKDAVVEENARWGSDGITVESKLVGDRPAGFQPPDVPIIQAAMLGVRAVGLEPVLEEPMSTDSNVPISLAFLP